MSGPKMTDAQRAEVLEAVQSGLHPQIACTAAGLGKTYFYDLRYRARKGDSNAQQFFDEIESAAAQSERADVKAVARATAPLNDQAIVCHECGAELQCDGEQLAAMVARLTDVAKAKGIAAEVAIKKLERRHPDRWSQKVVHTVEEQHKKLLDVCERELAPEDFERVLEAYVALGSGESEASGGQGEQAGGGVH